MSNLSEELIERPLRRIKKRDRPTWHPQSCDGPCCWDTRPMTDAEIRRKLRDNARNKDKPFSDKRSRWEQRNIVAWDGEGANLTDGTHIYNLLACSKGTSIEDHRGLDTQRVFKFFMENNSHSAINVIFGGSYDVNMILRDVHKHSLRELWNTGATTWEGWRISWTPRKKFSISPLKWNGKRYVKDGDRNFVLWDVFGYFQCSFVNACKQWKILDDLQLDAMQAMKFGRSTFTQEKLEDIRAYNEKEIEALVLLVRGLFSAMDEAGIQLERFDGAGSIASAYFRKNRVWDDAGDREEYMGVPRCSPVYRAAQFAYSGGRIEAISQGNYEGPVYRYDINSAYPSACLRLPSFRHAVWREDNYWNKDVNSIVIVDLHIKNQMPFYPSFWRAAVGSHKGRILYPSHATTAMYGWEYENLTKYWKHGRDYHLLSSINCHLDNIDKPFHWVKSIYQTRRTFKDAGSFAELCIKLGMNSIYGKLAQQEGYSKYGNTTRYPSTHHLLWAGLITSYTRSVLYQAAMQNPEAVISFATDAVFTTEPLDLPTNKELGGWSCDLFDGITLAQAGVYWLKHTADCTCDDCQEGLDPWHSKYRGFDPGSLQRDVLMDLWAQGAEEYPATLTRFAGLGGSLMRTDEHFPYIWRHWITDDRTLSLIPGGKRRLAERGKKRYDKGLVSTLPAWNIEGGMTLAYPIKWIEGYSISENPDYLLEEEWEDSYE